MKKVTEYKQDNISFNAEAAQGLSLEEFLAANQHQYPDYSEQNRNKKLTEAYNGMKEQTEKSNEPEAPKPSAEEAAAALKEHQAAISSYADRVIAGASMDSAVDLQFYANNKEEIEALLRERAAGDKTGKKGK